MTIMKAIAMTALAGTILAGPTAAIAKSTEHGNSATAHQNNTDRKAAHEALKAEREAAREARKAAHQSNQTDDQDDQDQDEDTTDETGDDANAGGGKALGKPNFGGIVSGLHTGSGTLTSSDLSNLSDSFTVQQVDLKDYAKGQRMRAIDNALRNVDQTTVQTTLESNPEVVAALSAQGITDLSSVSYAYVDASGNLVVYTR